MADMTAPRFAVRLSEVFNFQTAVRNLDKRAYRPDALRLNRAVR